MKRLHLFEFTDLGFWPGSLRTLLTDYLRMILDELQPFNRRVDLLARAVRATSEPRVLDLCSGGAGPWFHLQPELAKELGRDVEVLLTDKFPNTAVAADVARRGGAVKYHPNSVDARDVPESLDGVRTVVDGLHHFPPEQAIGILQDAVNKGQPIVIFESLGRSWRDLLQVLLLPIFVLLLTPKVRPFRWSRILFTYLIPIAPFLISWDVAVSVLRCYTVDELRSMADQLEGPRYTWEGGSYRHRGTPVTYFAGIPSGSSEARAD